MANQSIKSNDEIVLINREGESPQTVHDEGDSLNANVDIHSFFWDKDGPHKRDDFEPIAVDKDRKFSLTRFHYRGLWLWIGYRLKNKKPIAKFYTDFHIPLLCTNYRPYKLSEPTRFEDIFSYDALILAYFFSNEFQKMIKKKNIYETDGYREKYSSREVPDGSKFFWHDLEYVVVVGPSHDLGATDIPEFVKDMIKQIIER